MRCETAMIVYCLQQLQLQIMHMVLLHSLFLVQNIYLAYEWIRQMIYFNYACLFTI